MIEHSLSGMDKEKPSGSMKVGERQPRCPKRGRVLINSPCPLYPQKQTSCSTVAMSALCQKQTSTASFDHLVGAPEQWEWHGQAESLGGLEINDQLNFCGLLHR
jgi:hypothetical protein